MEYIILYFGLNVLLACMLYMCEIIEDRDEITLTLYVGCIIMTVGATGYMLQWLLITTMKAASRVKERFDGLR